MSWSRRVQCLGVVIEVGATGEVLARRAAALLAPYQSCDREPALRYELDEAGYSRDGKRVYPADDPLDVIPAFEIDLYRQLVARSQHYWMLHAAALAGDAGAVIVAGHSGDGKSTTTLALVTAGWSYITDEIAAIRSDGLVSGVPRPINLAGGVVPDSLPPGFTAARYPLRTAEGPVRDHGFLLPPPERVVHQWRSLVAMVRVRYAPGEQPGPRPLPAANALETFWACSHVRNPATLEIANRVLADLRAYELVTSSIDGARRDLERLVSRSGATD